jgi:hypothetical protein
MTTPAPLTLLEAVNVCLSSIGEPPVNAIDTAGIDAQIASDIINEISRTIQLKGWHWNRETGISLSPDINGDIVLPTNCARVDSYGNNKNIDVVQRGPRLYNRKDQTYVFTAALTLDMTVFLPFEELPSAARDCIAVRAAAVFQQRILSSDTLDGNLRLRAQEAYAELVREEMQIADHNMLRDSWSTYGIVQRGNFRRGGFQSGVY